MSSKANYISVEAPDAIPTELKDHNQWICWKEEKRDGKPTKIPISPESEQAIDATDPDNFVEFEKAYQAHVKKGFRGIGFAFTESDPFIGIDLDNCRGPDTEQIDGQAKDIIEILDSYTEISPSDNGLHTIVKADITPRRNRFDNIEIYSKDRFFTVTGDSLGWCPREINPRSEELKKVFEKYGPENQSHSPEVTSPQNDQRTDFSDDEIIRKATNAKNGAKFKKLFKHGDISDYPSQSEADLALCSLLAFWSKDRSQIQRIFGRSALNREKWQERPDYRQRTIKKALEGQQRNREGTDQLNYPILEEDKLKLSLQPVDGDKTRIQINEGDQLKYDEKQDFGFWENSAKRTKISSRIAKSLEDYNESFLKEKIKKVLNRLNIDAQNNPKKLETLKHSPQVKQLRQRTKSVTIFPSAESTTLTVELNPPADSRSEVSTSQVLKFSEGDINDHNATNFQNQHIAKFYSKFEINAEEWTKITDFWLEEGEIKERDPDHEAEATLDKFVSWIDTMDVWPDEEYLDTDRRNGLFKEDFDENHAVILIPAKIIIEWLHDQEFDVDSQKFARIAKKRDLLVTTNHKIKHGGAKQRFWVINANKTCHELENLAEVPDEEDAPEGLRS